VKTHFLQVIGIGPSSLGLLVAADRQSVLCELLNEGVVFIDKSPNLDGLKYDIASNTAAKDFLSGISEHGAFRDVLLTEEAKYLNNLNQKSVNLLIVNRALTKLHSTALNIIEANPHSAITLGTTISHVGRDSNSLYTSYDQAGLPVATSKNVLIATGARETSEPIGEWLSTLKGQAYLSSDVLSADEPSFIHPALRLGAPIAIIGGSHSAFSVAELLIRKYGNAIAEKQIRIIRRRQTRLRSSARSLYVEIKKRLENRVEILDNALVGPPSFDSENAVYISACGYVPVDIPVIPEEGGNPVAFAKKDGQFLIDPTHRLLDIDLRPLEGLYGIGIGRTKRIEGDSPFPGTKFKVSVKYFHNAGADSILENLIRKVAETNQAVNA